MTNTFCPFIRETCKGNECMMFRDEECLLVSFLKAVREGAPTPEEGMPQIQEGIGRGGLFAREEEEAPDWIKDKTPEELAVEIFEFAKKEKREGLDYVSASSQFWESKGINEFLMPSEVQSKMRRASFLARRQAVQEEKDELPSLIGKCVDWARTHDMNKVALQDVEAFLSEKDLHILRETMRALYSRANVKLKSDE